MNDDMILGTYVPYNEELHREYKEFCFKLVLLKYYQIDELNQIIQKGNLKDDFNHIIIANIYKYFDIYVPRYFCSFHNTNRIDDSTLLIGIDDHREVTGIPYDGNLAEFENFFNRHVSMILNTLVDGRCCVDVEIKVVKCLTDEDFLSDLMKLEDLQKEEQKFIEYKESYRLYHTKRKEWVEKLYFYKGKLQSFLNNTNIKEEFILFLIEQNVYERFLVELSADDISFTGDVIQKYRNEPTHIIYWLILFKDIRSTEILNDKPVAPLEPQFKPLIHRMMTKLSGLRGIFTKHGIKYYIIVIHFKKNNKSCDSKLKFLEKRCGSRYNYWRSMKRNYFGSQNPQCIDL